METFYDRKKEFLTGNSKWSFSLEIRWPLVAKQELRWESVSSLLQIITSSGKPTWIPLQAC